MGSPSRRACRRGLVIRVACTFLAIACSVASAVPPQTVSAPKVPQALTLANQALQALAGSTAIADITLSGTATYIAGSDRETGSATLEALGNLQSRVTLNLTGGQRQWIRSGRAGVWVGTDGVVHAIALHNLWTDANWFFPALTLAAAVSDPSVGLRYVSAETKLGTSVQHIQIYRILPMQPRMNAIIQRLSATDVYLDASSNLPLAIDFNVHPDNNAAVNIGVEIRCSNYQPVGAMRVPFRIQKYQQGSLVLDLAVSSAVPNSGLTTSSFVLPPVQESAP